MTHELTNFHQHSGYSFLDGCSNPDAIVARCKELGMHYACLSDHGNVAGHIDFYDQCRAQGLTPVLGTELYTVDEKYENGKTKGYHLCVWAMNEEGLHNVWAISSNTYYGTGEGHKTPNTHWEHMQQHGRGVACSSACLGGAISEAAKVDDENMALYFMRRYQDIFDYFYIEIHTNSMDEQRGVNLWLVNFAHKYNVPIVYAVDAHYALAEDGDFHDVWLGCQVKANYDEPHWTMEHEYFIHSEEQIRSCLSYLGADVVEECFCGVDDFLSHVETYDIDNEHKIPVFPLPEGWTDTTAYFECRVFQGLLERVAGVETHVDGGKLTYVADGRDVKKIINPYMEQLMHTELPIIEDNGLEDYFLIVADYTEYAKKHTSVGPGRGSALASIVCYVLGITDVDPMGQGMYFSRFLNEGRLNLYEVTYDGGKVEKAGDGYKVDGVKLSKLRVGDDTSKGTITKIEQVNQGSMPDIDIDFADKTPVRDHLIDMYGEDKVTAVGTITYFQPKSAIKEVCRYYRVPMRDSNHINKIMDVFEDMEIDDWHRGLDKISSEDAQFMLDYEANYPQLFRLAERMVGLPRNSGKHAAGYIISPVSLSSILPVRRSDDGEIISQFDKVAVERMGFLKADLLGLRNCKTLADAADMVEERTGELIEYPKLVADPEDDEVWQIFEEGDTLGVFQMEGAAITGVAMQLKPRSVKEVAVILALYRPGCIYSGILDHYIARALGKEEVTYPCPQAEAALKDTYGEWVFQEQIMQICVDVAGYSPKRADDMRSHIAKKHIDQLKAERPIFIKGCREHSGVSEKVASEMFDKMEAAGDYLFNLAHAVGYATITYWTAYMKAHHPLEFLVASMGTVGFDKAPLYIAEAHRRGIDVVPPVLSGLDRSYRILDKKTVAFGLGNVKGCGKKAVEKIMAAYPYKDYADFVERSGANKTVKKALINVGCFREENENRRDMYMRLMEPKPQEEPYRPYTKTELAELEQNLLGITLSVGPLDDYRDQLGDVYRKCISSDRFETVAYGTTFLTLGKVVEVRLWDSKSGTMSFTKVLSDDDGLFEMTVFASLYSAGNEWLKAGKVNLMEVKKDVYNGKASYQLVKLYHMN